MRAGKRRRGRSSSSDLAPGTQVGRFVVVEKLGKGGMGVVYAARDPVLDRRVAIKLWRPHDADERSSARGRMLREAQALAQLSHPNVVAVHDFGEHGDGVFLAMELVSGKSLRQWIREAARAPADVIAVMRAAGAGLAAAHKIGIVHRDFKPDNVIVADDGRVRVLDFGLARAIGGRSADDLPTDPGETPTPLPLSSPDHGSSP